MENQALVKEICPTKTQLLIKNGALLVDVREREEVAQLAYNVPNIVNIPLTEFEERFTEIPRDREVVVVCKSGVRSLRATAFLKNHGYNHVVNMKHGIIRWVQKGFPTIGDESFVLVDENTHSCSCSGC
ncbi:rhodanese-like domain-containing protein [Flavobacterium taihuense]|uniref:Rhodanese-like domain-containing protein n=1 Tax=Flavobacterium taihuense TaxID=2857508 RepID=A0ABS6XW91_9FLAO|nr:rhodanese-like domain-containing protein [Flavobacterium taihuense]MBW4360953.1 rhodanese-like domain-containing protein [Flavobacterium taihuense]